MTWSVIAGIGAHTGVGVESSEAEINAEAAVVRAAIANGNLSPAQLREALLLREELARAGQRVGLLQLLRQRFLAEHVIPGLTKIYRETLATSGAQATAYEPVSPALLPQAEERTRALLSLPPNRDAPRVRDFLTRALPNLRRTASGRLIPHTAEVEAVAPVGRDSDSGPMAGFRDSDSARLIPHTANVQAVPPSDLGGVGHQGSDSGRLAPHSAAGRPVPDSGRLRPPSSDEITVRTGGPAQRFGRYLVESEIARGGMGVVFLARDPQLERKVALKVMQGDGFEPDEVDKERFLREARATAKMQHPNIVSVLDSGTDRGYPYLVMDLVEGESVGDLIKRGGPLDPDEAARIAAGVARALHYSHERQVLHRDVKPNNILLERSRDVPMLTDFGLARTEREAESQLTATGQAVGTPSYMAPEQATGETENYGPHTDVYGLGATLYHMLVGSPPFRGGTLEVMHKVLVEPPVPPRKLRESVPPALERICLRCLAKAPEDRYASAAEVADALDALSAPSLAAAPTPTRRDISAIRPAVAPAEAKRNTVGRVVLAAISLCALGGLIASMAYVGQAERELEEASADPAQTLETSRERLALKYLNSLTENPAAGPEWQQTYGIKSLGVVDELPWRLEEALELFPQLPAQRAVIAVALGRQERLPEADAYLGDDPTSTRLRALLRSQAGLYEESLALLEDLPDSPETVTQRIQDLFELQRVTEVLQAIQKLPWDSTARRHFETEEGLARLEGEDRVTALSNLLTESLSNRSRYRILLSRAQARIEQKDFASARRDIDHAEEIRPGQPAAPYLSYMIATRQLDHARSVQHLDQTIERERHPKKLEKLRYFRIQALGASGDTVGAQAALNELRREPAWEDMPEFEQARCMVWAGELEPGSRLALSIWEDAERTLPQRASGLEVYIEALESKQAWSELESFIVGLQNQELPRSIQPRLQAAFENASRHLGNR